MRTIGVKIAPKTSKIIASYPINRERTNYFGGTISSEKQWSLFNQAKPAQYDGLSFKEAKAIVMILSPEERLSWYAYCSDWTDWKPIKECVELVTFSRISHSKVGYRVPPNPMPNEEVAGASVRKLEPANDDDSIENRQGQETADHDPSDIEDSGTVTQYQPVENVSPQPRVKAKSSRHYSERSALDDDGPVKWDSVGLEDDSPFEMETKYDYKLGTKRRPNVSTEVSRNLPGEDESPAEEPTAAELNFEATEQEIAKHPVEVPHQVSSGPDADEIDKTEIHKTGDYETKDCEADGYEAEMHETENHNLHATQPTEANEANDHHDRTVATHTNFNHTGSIESVDYQDDVTELSKRSKVDQSVLDAKDTDEALEHMRRFKRHEVRFHVEVVGSHQRFTSFTVDVSLGGIQIEDSIPDWVAGYCTVMISTLDLENRLEFMCSIVENQEGERTRLEIYPSSDTGTLRDWLEKGIPQESAS